MAKKAPSRKAARKVEKPQKHPSTIENEGASGRKKAPPSGQKRHLPTTIEQHMEHFGEEMETLGKRVSERARKNRCESWYCRTFGAATPLISSIFGILILIAGVWLLGFVNLPLGSSFLSSLQSFLYSNLGLFFLFILFFSYSSYISKNYRHAFRPFSPLAAAAGVTVAAWIFMNVIGLANLSMGNAVLASMELAIGRLMPVIFGVSIFIGYIALVVSMSAETRVQGRAVMEKPKPMRHEAGEMRRLYRSGRDKILGGVCGGMGEYFGIDPVIVRLIFVALAFAWGLGILLYVISWIIIPRNPTHKWDR